MRSIVVLLTLVLLTACVPAAVQGIPPDEPIVYNASFEELFEVTFEVMLDTYWTGGLGQRVGMAVQSVDRENGLILADNVTTAPDFFRSGLGPQVIRDTVTVHITQLADGTASVRFVPGGGGVFGPGIAYRYINEVILRLDQRLFRAGH